VLPSGRVRILLDYRPALRHRTGVGEFAHNMAAALILLGGGHDQVTLFSSSWKDRLPRDVLPGASRLDRRVPVSLLNLAWHRLGWPPVELLGGRAQIAWSLHPLLMPSARAAQIITIYDLYFLDHPAETAGEVRRDYAPLVRSHAHRADGVIVISEYTRQQVIERLGVPPDKIAVCLPGAPSWAPREPPASAGPILHLGTVEPRKNVPALLRAYRQLLRSDPAAPPLVLAGRAGPLDLDGGDDAEQLRRQIQVLGYVSDDERLRLFREASMLVLASADEGFGMTAVEAMAMGVPVVASNRGSLPEVIGDAGILVDASDASAFAAAMQRVLGDAALRHDLTSRGIERARRFSWATAAATARAAFETALDRRRRRGR
jgi:glycosyltransferase involved in cell wall biosynthesis